MLIPPRFFAAALFCLVARPGFCGPVFEYAADDGTGFTESSLASYDARVTWGNAYLTQSPWTTITAVRVSFASDLGAGRSIQVAVFNDPSNDADPRDAQLVSIASHTVPGATGPTEFLDFAIDPAPVSGWFFVAVIADLGLGERAMRQDFSTLGVSSWRFDNPTGEDNFDLGAAGFGGRLSDFGLGTWMVRAVAVPSPWSGVTLGLGLLGARRGRIR